MSKPLGFTSQALLAVWEENSSEVASSTGRRTNPDLSSKRSRVGFISSGS